MGKTEQAVLDKIAVFAKGGIGATGMISLNLSIRSSRTPVAGQCETHQGYGEWPSHRSAA